MASFESFLVTLLDDHFKRILGLSDNALSIESAHFLYSDTFSTLALAPEHSP